MVSSVDKYHGFYIGRYEVTENGEKPGVSLGGTISNKTWTWYALYNKCLTFGKKENNVEITESSMMYGALWDATMQWLAKSKIPVGYRENQKTSGYGNYTNENITVSNNKESNRTTIKVKASGTYTKLRTGQTSYTGRKNIYDLSGNCSEWTQEAYDINTRVLRGSFYGDSNSSSTYSACRSTSFHPIDSRDYCSSRAQLYIK